MADPIPSASPPEGGKTLELPPVEAADAPAPGDAAPPSPPPSLDPAPKTPRTMLPAGILAEPSTDLRHLSIVPSLGLSLTTLPLEYFKNRLMTQGLVLDDALSRGEIPSGQAGSVKR